MKYFVVSDVHSFLTPLKEALDAQGFDPNNPNHTLVSCGDLFDRGEESLELLEYIKSLPRKILIMGNHDLLLRDAIIRKAFEWYDVNNGTLKTAYHLCGHKNDTDYLNFPSLQCLKELGRNKDYNDYYSKLIPYFETEHYIFVHSWLPLEDKGWTPFWREETDRKWERATWDNPFLLAEQGLNRTGKTIVFGHWHTSFAHARQGNGTEFKEGCCFKPFYGDNYIGIDGCTTFSGMVNCIVIEDTPV